MAFEIALYMPTASHQVFTKIYATATQKYYFPESQIYLDGENQVMHSLLAKKELPIPLANY